MFEYRVFMADAILKKNTFIFKRKDFHRISIYALSILTIVFLSLFKLIYIPEARFLTISLLIFYFILIKLLDKSFNLSKLTQYLIIFIPLIYYTEYLFLPNFIDYLFILTFILCSSNIYFFYLFTILCKS